MSVGKESRKHSDLGVRAYGRAARPTRRRQGWESASALAVAAIRKTDTRTPIYWAAMSGHQRDRSPAPIDVPTMSDPCSPVCYPSVDRNWECLLYPPITGVGWDGPGGSRAPHLVTPHAPLTGTAPTRTVQCGESRPHDGTVSRSMTWATRLTPRINAHLLLLSNIATFDRSAEWPAAVDTDSQTNLPAHLRRSAGMRTGRVSGGGGEWQPRWQPPRCTALLACAHGWTTQTV